MVDPELAASVEAFLRKHPKLENPDRAENQCVIATGQLIDELREAGRAAEKIWFRGHRAPVTFDPPGPGVNAEHAAVLVDGELVVDVTRRQYESGAALPTVYLTVADAGRHWLAYQRDAERRGHYEPLGPPG